MMDIDEVVESVSREVSEKGARNLKDVDAIINRHVSSEFRSLIRSLVGKRIQQQSS